MMGRGPQLLLVALGAAAASAVILLCSHFFWLRPVWAFAPTPPDALPTAAVSLPTVDDYAKYQGFLLSALAAAGVAFNAWLWAMRALKKQPDALRPSVWRRALPLLLLVPCAVHFVGAQRYNRESIRVNGEWLKNYRERKARRQSGPGVTEAIPAATPTTACSTKSIPASGNRAAKGAAAAVAEEPANLSKAPTCNNSEILGV